MKPAFATGDMAWRCGAGNAGYRQHFAQPTMVFMLIRGQSMLIYARQEETVDEICWRYYGRTQQAVEQVYAANPGLAEKGPTLPHGCKVVLPDLPQAATGETLNLWD